MAGFCVDEAVLFLDTHPSDVQALAAYQTYRSTKEILEKEYATKYGPLRADDVPAGQMWTWTQLPWPWEGEE